MKRSEELQLFNKIKDQLNTSLSQLQFALDDDNHDVLAVTSADDLDVDAEKRILILTIHNKQTLHGQYWSLAVSLRCDKDWKIFSLPMKLLPMNSKWKFHIPLDFDISLQDLPIKVKSKLIFKSTRENLKLELDPWLDTELTALHFVRIKSGLVTTNDSNNQDNKEVSNIANDFDLNEDDFDGASFEDFLDKVNAQRVLSEVTISKSLKSVIVNVSSTDDIKFLRGQHEKTLYIDLLGTALSVSIEPHNKLTIRGSNLEAMLKLKQDILSKSSKGNSGGLGQQSWMSSITNIIETIDDYDEKDCRLDYCYKNLRDNSSSDVN